MSSEMITKVCGYLLFRAIKTLNKLEVSMSRRNYKGRGFGIIWLTPFFTIKKIRIKSFQEDL